MTPFERAALSALLYGSTCTACYTKQITYVGIPPAAAAITFCGTNGVVRTALDADLFRMNPDGTLAARASVPEVLAHEAVHREQLEARRREPGKCPPDFTVAELVRAEIEAYCVGAQAALKNGARPIPLARSYAGAFRSQFGSLMTNVQEYVEPRWNELCPSFQLIWDAGP